MVTELISLDQIGDVTHLRMMLSKICCMVNLDISWQYMWNKFNDYNCQLLILTLVLRKKEY